MYYNYSYPPEGHDLYRTYWRIETQDGDQWDGREFSSWFNDNGKRYEDDNGELFIDFERAVVEARSNGDLEVRVVEVDEYWSDDIENDVMVIRSVSLERIAA